jgi:hypothetical protein
MRQSILVKHHFKEILDAVFNLAIQQNIPYADRGYCIPAEIIENALLFIGINPSYASVNTNSTHFNCFSTHQQSGADHAYYRKFATISNQVKVPWSHLDMLFYQETAQNSFHEIEKANGGKEFIATQLQITKQILEKAKPKVIVVSNTLARKLFNENLNLNCVFDNEIGTHRINEGLLKGTPVFFTSMLTGQRALDNGSFERLQWHIDCVLRG